MTPSPRLLLAVAAGGALGALLRAWLSVVLVGQAWPALLGGTLAANVIGAFAMGAYAALTGPDGRWPHGPVRRQFWMAGVFGGLTTFSIFSLEALLIAQAAGLVSAGGHVLGALALWMAAVWAGHRLGRRLNG